MGGEGTVIWEGEDLAPGRASGACLALLDRGLAEAQVRLDEADLFLADLGPGSFTGVRIGVVLAKTLAWTKGKKCAGADAFDLIDPKATVALPSKRGEFFVRSPVRSGAEAPHSKALSAPADAIGYGFEGGERYPRASGFAALLDSLTIVSPEQLVPAYLIEPSISQSKKPLSRVQA